MILRFINPFYILNRFCDQNVESAKFKAKWITQYNGPLIQCHRVVVFAGVALNQASVRC